ncbi:MAG: hypothetical protein F7C07_01820 [Desulfurococcales archaeon]|nr:hypothetical protein [Desulfurococcales archaeon]
MWSLDAVREEFYKGHYRILKLEREGTVFYSIDVYYRLGALKKEELEEWCDTLLELEDYALCYKRLVEDCEAVVLVTPKGAELVNLRLITSTGKDPGKESLLEARSHCASIVEKSFNITLNS